MMFRCLWKDAFERMNRLQLVAYVKCFRAGYDQLQT